MGEKQKICLQLTIILNSIILSSMCATGLVPCDGKGTQQINQCKQ